MAKRKRTHPMGYSPQAWRMIGRGIELGLIIGGMTFLGYLGDERWGTGPWLAFSGAMLGMLGGTYNLAKDMLFAKPRNGPSQPSDTTDDPGPGRC